MHPTRRFADAPAALRNLCYRVLHGARLDDPISGGVFREMRREAYALAYRPTARDAS